MHRMRLDVFDQSNRKRPAPAEPTDGLDPAKRQRMGVTVVPPLPPGPVSYRQLFTLDPSGGPAFDVQAFQDPDQLLSILVPVLQAIDATKLDNAINVRDQFQHAVAEACMQLSQWRSDGRLRDVT
jgi:symplekin